MPSQIATSPRKETVYTKASGLWPTHPGTQRRTAVSMHGARASVGCRGKREHNGTRECVRVRETQARALS